MKYLIDKSRTVQCEDRKKKMQMQTTSLYFLLFVKWLHLQVQKIVKLRASSRLPSVDSSSTDTEDQLYIYF